ncbi:MAG: GtrA family protein [Spirochaetota bacterium]|nr:GtrA family protein [Spirochaetota bacterium]
MISKLIHIYNNNKKEIKLFLKYCIVGVSNTIVGLGTILILYNIFKVDYRLSNIIGYTLGLINSFILNKMWTFRSKSVFYKEIIPFFLFFLVSYIINLGAVVFCVEILLINKNISQLIGMVFYTSTNFIGNRLWTFKNELL